MTERSDFDDEDKVMHTFIGKTELNIDKILQQLLIQDVRIDLDTQCLNQEYETYRNIILQDTDVENGDNDDIFSNNSLQNKIYPEQKQLIQTKGKVDLSFTAELTETFLKRVEGLKRAFIHETVENIEQLAQNLDSKLEIIKQAIETLNYVGFDIERGLMLDELTIKDRDGGSTIINKSQLMGSINDIGKNQDIIDEKKSLKKKNMKEIQALELPDTNRKRMCGCETCIIF